MIKPKHDNRSYWNADREIGIPSLVTPRPRQPQLQQEEYIIDIYVIVKGRENRKTKRKWRKLTFANNAFKMVARIVYSVLFKWEQGYEYRNG